jgi:hypothetical protein
MKNIHILPTDKPSRYVTNYMEQNMQWQNIYITNSEEIKEGDWILFQNVLTKALKGERFSGKEKIILTIDQDLIADGVQPIDDEFLQWFVAKANDSGVPIDEVEIDYQTKDITEKGEWLYDYSIIIPKQEQPICDGCGNSICCCLMKTQETLEEAAEKCFKEKEVLGYTYEIEDGFKLGAKWQAERMYSEEDLRKAFIAGGNSFIEEDDCYGSQYKEYMEEWFNKFKKK